MTAHLASRGLSIRAGLLLGLCALAAGAVDAGDRTRVRGERLRPSGVIRPSVEVEVGFSPSLQRSRVQFIVWNGREATSGIERFGVSGVRRPLVVHSPPQWTATYGWPLIDSVVVWSDVDTLTPDAAPLQDVPSPYGVMPGDSALVFTMFLSSVPARVTCWAQGFTPTAKMGEEARTYIWDWSAEVEVRQDASSGKPRARKK